MELAPSIALQWLHILTGATWVGGSALMAFVVYPFVLDRPPEEARAAFDRMAKPATIFFASVGHTTVLLGVLRGTLLGPVQSLAMLWETPYGRTFSVAFVLSLVLAIFGAKSSKAAPELIAQGKGAKVLAGARMSVLGFALVLLTMAMMRFGG